MVNAAGRLLADGSHRAGYLAPAGALNLLQLGEEEAHYLGVEVAVVQRLLLLCSALLVAAAVAVSGVIGFVGLVVPHRCACGWGPTTGR